MGSKRVTTANVARFRKLAAGGMPQRKIAEEMGFAPSTVHNYLSGKRHPTNAQPKTPLTKVGTCATCGVFAKKPPLQRNKDGVYRCVMCAARKAKDGG